ncbi:MAG: class I SAM-dependent methyltransferase [Pseudomonadota bacterium]
MKKKVERHININDALKLNGDPQAIIDYYKGWATTYDVDVQENYYGIGYIAELLGRSLQHKNTNTGELLITDVGCGTGLLAPALVHQGFSQLEGIDLSHDMIEKARETNLYRALHAGIDLHHTLPSPLQQRYDAAVCLGVFTPGHVAAEALFQLIHMTKPGGTVITSTRVPYYDNSNYRAVNEQLAQQQLATLTHSELNAPYRDDGNAHYWVYKVA